MNRVQLTERWHARRKAFLVLTGSPSAAGLKWLRYMERPTAPMWCRQRDGKIYVEDVRAVGLRLIGEVNTEPYRGARFGARFNTTADHGGWYTNDEGLSSKDGDGLCWGVVYQLPGRRKLMRVVAGYQFGGCDSGPTIDFSRIYEGRCDDCHDLDPKLSEPAREAALHADDMARDAAEEERDYQHQQREQDHDDDEREMAG